jgi:hypothetical protein
MFAILLGAILQLQRKGSAGASEALVLDWYASGRSKLFSVPARQLRIHHVRITPSRRRRNRRPERARLSGRERIASVARA